MKQGNLRRNAVWTSSLAAGSEAFAEKIKRRLGKIQQNVPKLLNGPDHALREDLKSYKHKASSYKKDRAKRWLGLRI